MGKLLFREIRKSLGRFLAIMAIIALGVGFFTGLKVANKAMVLTGQEYFEETHFHHFQLLSTLGLTDKDVQSVAALDGVAAAEGMFSADVLVDNEGTDRVMTAYTLPQQVDLPQLIAGRMPQAADECVVDVSAYGEEALGNQLRISSANTEDDAAPFLHDSYTIVGLVVSPLYVNYERGATALGSGTVAGFFYVLPSGIDSDIYTAISLTLDQQADLYSPAYEALEEKYEPQITELLTQLAQQRYDELVSDAEEQLAEARQSLADGQSQLDEANEQLSAGEQELTQGEREYAAQKQTLADGQSTYAAGQKELSAREKELSAAKQSLEEGEATLSQKEQELAQARQALDEGQAALQAAQEELNRQLALVPPQSPEYEALLQAQAELDAQQEQLKQQELAYAQGQAELEGAKTQLAEQRTQYDAAVSALAAGQKQLQQSAATLAKGEKALAQARQTLDEGWAELEENRQTLAQKQQELEEGQAEVDEGAKALAEIQAPTTYVLSRSENIGYACFESDTGIVEGIAVVFPLFFLLVAVLVCTTTMTRMVDEQRTQIGTLKALGYGDGAVMQLYLWYVLLASLTGCGIGFLLGSWGFPKVIWFTYDMMYDFYRPIRLVLDAGLAAASILMYLACALLATWGACKTSLREPAAQLIRPKAPQPGKRIFLEHIPFLWRRMKFLHKVSARNVFRYHRRLIMMVLGIGGCMALLITGFGLGDSIQNVVSDQFDTISRYDFSVNFSQAMEEGQDREDFLAGFSGQITQAAFIHQSAVDVTAGNTTKNVYLIVPGENIKQMCTLQTKDGQTVPLPGPGQAVINTGLADALGVKVGDTFTVYDADHRPMSVQISGCFVNYIYNYVFVDAQTCQQAWGQAPACKTAWLQAGQDTDVFAVAAALRSYDGVASVVATQEFRDRVGSIMENLNVIVFVVVLCAGALAFIVLFNLTNINVNERVREIATLKVLGFYPRETSSYVFRENLVLTAIGAIFGIPLGILLHRYVMAQIKIDMICFPVRICWQSYLYALALCFLFALVVELFMSRRLRKIPMAESLKGAE